MKKNIIIIVIIAIVAFVVLYRNNLPSTKSILNNDYKNTSYEINGVNVKLINGKAENKISPDSASKEGTNFFGNEARADLNNDGLEDVAFLLSQTTGGSGTFYYVVAALKTSDGYIGTNAILLGDRIAPQNTTISSSTIIVNYADRKKDEAMVIKPSIGVSKYLKIIDNKLLEIVK